MKGKILMIIIVVIILIGAIALVVKSNHSMTSSGGQSITPEETGGNVDLNSDQSTFNEIDSAIDGLDS